MWVHVCVAYVCEMCLALQPAVMGWWSAAVLTGYASGLIFWSCCACMLGFLGGIGARRMVRVWRCWSCVFYSVASATGMLVFAVDSSRTAIAGRGRLFSASSTVHMVGTFFWLWVVAQGRSQFWSSIATSCCGSEGVVVCGCVDLSC